MRVALGLALAGLLLSAGSALALDPARCASNAQAQPAIALAAAQPFLDADASPVGLASRERDTGLAIAGGLSGAGLARLGALEHDTLSLAGPDANPAGVAAGARNGGAELVVETGRFATAEESAGLATSDAVLVEVGALNTWYRSAEWVYGTNAVTGGAAHAGALLQATGQSGAALPPASRFATEAAASATHASGGVRAPSDATGLGSWPQGRVADAGALLAATGAALPGATSMSFLALAAAQGALPLAASALPAATGFALGVRPALQPCGMP